jgi:hypothetical protein
MSMKDVNRKPARITVEDISKVAAQGVARALEARTAQGIDLTEDEVGHVSGGYPSSSGSTVGYAPPEDDPGFAPLFLPW